MLSNTWKEIKSSKDVRKAGASGCIAPAALGPWVQTGAEKALFDTSQKEERIKKEKRKGEKGEKC